MLEDAQNWFVGLADIKNAFHQMRIPWWLQTFFALPAVFLVRTTLPMGFSRTMFLSRCHGPLCARGECRSSSVCRDHSAPPLLGSKHGMGSRGFRWSCADILGEVLARGENCTDVRLARRVAALQKTTYPLPTGVPMFSVVKFLQPKRIEVERASGYHALVQ